MALADHGDFVSDGLSFGKQLTAFWLYVNKEVFSNEMELITFKK